MNLQVVIYSSLGTFLGEVIEIDDNSYDDFIKASDDFYLSGFEMKLENGDYIIIPPDVIKSSILKIKKI